MVDRDDMINGANYLIESGRVDSEKVCIMGSSAGGYLVLNALIHSNVFKAAVSVYGVADLVAMAKETHKFEKGYNEALAGKYPEEEKIYHERSPINHVDKLTTPTAFLHGTEDTVVASSQSVMMYEGLKAKGITTALQLYEGFLDIRGKQVPFRGRTRIPWTRSRQEVFRSLVLLLVQGTWNYSVYRVRSKLFR